jgi:hypothetical protein
MQFDIYMQVWHFLKPKISAVRQRFFFLNFVNETSHIDTLFPFFLGNETRSRPP